MRMIALYSSGNTWECVHNVLQLALNSIGNWLLANALKLNVKQCLIVADLNMRRNINKTLKPIFHWEQHSRWVPNAEKKGINNMKCTWPTRKCCVGDPQPPIFHWKWGLRWLPNANEIYKKRKKCTWPTQEIGFT